MNEILKAEGGNEYKIPHMNKAKLEKADTLPTILDVDPCVVAILDDLYDENYQYDDSQASASDTQLTGFICQDEINGLKEDALADVVDALGNVSDGSLDSWTSDED
jgi:hypothetical protein